tara:strand:- start:365 stop:565 length:201 start_codon:yes stop_codon:yes gene_type:complete
MNKISSINEFVIKFANVNGSGSASANGMFSKGIFRSGIPVSPKIFFHLIFKVFQHGLKFEQVPKGI